MTLEVQGRNSVVEETAQGRERPRTGSGRDLGRCHPAYYPTLSPQPPPPPFPTHRDISSGFPLGNSRPTSLGPWGVGVVERVVVTTVTYPGQQKCSPGMHLAEASSVVSI